MTTPLVLLALKCSLVLLLAFGVTGLLRRASAASRHLVWLAAFLGVVALPLAALVLPALSVPLPFLPRTPAPAAAQVAWYDASQWQKTVDGYPRATTPVLAPASAVEAKAAIAASRGSAAPLAADVAPPAYVADVPPAAAGLPWSARFVLVWLAGAVMVGVAFAVGVLRTHLLACAALPAGRDLAEEAEVLSASLGIVRDVRVVAWPGPAMPMTWGARRPVVLLPDAARAWPADRRREVLLHELAHVRRGDWLARLLAALVCAIHWFNPLAWMAARKLRDEQELACDDLVLAHGVRPSDYAAHLLEVARGLRAPAGVAHAVAMARPSQLSNRLLAVLDPERARASTRRTATLVAAAALAVVLPLAALTAAQPAAARAPVAPAMAASAMATSADGSASVAVAYAGPADQAPAIAAGAPRNATAATLVQCPEDARRGRGSHASSSNSVSDDGSPRRTTLSVRRGNCIIEVRILGAIHFEGDRVIVDDAPTGAALRVTEEGNGPDRRYELGTRNGRREERFYVDGDAVSETPELRAWLQETLRQAFEGTGFDAPARAMRAYRAGGIDSVLRLVAGAESDYARRMYLAALMDSVRVPARDAARIARAAAGMSSDYEKAELLIAVARKVALDAQVQAAMAEAAVGMSSDYERKRVLLAALERDDLPSDAATDLLRAAERMESDYEKAEVLIGFLARQPLDAPRRAAFFRAIGGMSSDYERKRVLVAVIGRPETPLPIASDIAAVAERSSSDYERAEVLTALARKVGGNADARARIRQATQSMSSDYERDRVLAALGRWQ